jgi:site-specific DNA recombinase
METLERHNVTLVSVTQHFNTTSSMGRLTLNILLSFAQFEREMISERTKDKIGAMRRRGKHWGGHPVLGYDTERTPGGVRLVINPVEAERVRTMFELYQQHQAIMPVVEEITRRGWRNKAWKTKAGKARGDGVIDKPTLWRILTNVVYFGKVSYAGEIYEGEHEAIISPEVWQVVQSTLVRNGRSGGHAPDSTRRDSALLKGLLVCKACGSAMTPTYTVKDTKGAGRKRYRYYACGQAAKRGHQRCPCPTLPAGEIERFVVQEIAGIGRDSGLRDQVLDQAQQRLGEGDQGRNRHGIDRQAATDTLSEFDTVWQTLSPNEQNRLMQLLIERVVFDHAGSRVSITFRPTGIATLSNQPDPIGAEDSAIQESAA